jgi:hypothetical protein
MKSQNLSRKSQEVYRYRKARPGWICYIGMPIAEELTGRLWAFVRQKRPLGRNVLNGFSIWKVLRAFDQLYDVQSGRGSVCLGLSAIPHGMLGRIFRSIRKRPLAPVFWLCWDSSSSEARVSL